MSNKSIRQAALLVGRRHRNRKDLKKIGTFARRTVAHRAVQLPASAFVAVVMCVVCPVAENVFFRSLQGQLFILLFFF